MAAPPRFCNLSTTAGIAIYQAATRGVYYGYEDVTVAIWEELPRLFFPYLIVAYPGPCYRVAREPYRNRPPGEIHKRKPDVVIVQVHITIPPLLFSLVNRDTIWIECKAPNDAHPAG
ncbi:hypothetical protein PT974_05153 [Cladobotryum mycophilum]|uniref:Uncharacterized protein n=1 Tax=Cladobotryum mycophilum TaxID=491253 RepID=A0ABR0SRC8_9HYPO